MRKHDPKAFTSILINSGYRAYSLTVPERPDFPEKVYIVWAKPQTTVVGWQTRRTSPRNWDKLETETQPQTETSLPDLSEFAEGDMLPLRMRGRVVQSTDVIMIAVEDGGGIVTGYERTIM